MKVRHAFYLTEVFLRQPLWAKYIYLDFGFFLKKKKKEWLLRFYYCSQDIFN